MEASVPSDIATALEAYERKVGEIQVEEHRRKMSIKLTLAATVVGGVVILVKLIDKGIDEQIFNLIFRQ